LRKSRIIVALSAPVFAVTAIAASGGLSATASAQPVSQVRAARLADTTSAIALQARASTLRVSARAVMATRHRRHHRRRTPKQIAWNIMHWFGWKAKWQFRYLNWLWTRESSWNVYATNPYSGAYGIPQAVPGSKMGSCGRDWRWSAETQIRWGMRYIKRTYRSPRRAWAHEVNDGWY
jgi:hypothetical protein